MTERQQRAAGRGLVLAFDVYGTLIDTAGMTGLLEPLAGAHAAEFARLWREKQVEYSFRRGLMRRYEPFAVCVRDAFDFSCAVLGITPSAQDRGALLDAYRRLPPFADAAESLARLDVDGFSLYAFSNGTREAVDTLLESAGLGRWFLDIVSVDEVGSFKPDPAVYRHCLHRCGAEGAGTWLVSSNPFDVIGAVSAGMRGIWVRRSEAAVFDPWGIEPTLTVQSLLDVGERVAAFEAAQTGPSP
jgi:2-haloacid dehalogenase